MLYLIEIINYNKERGSSNGRSNNIYPHW